MELIKKLSTKTIIGKITRDMIPAKGMLPLYRVVGIAMGTKTGETNYGMFVGFRGNFKATRIEDGAVFHSPVCFLPQMASDLLLPVVENDQSGMGVQFGFDIGIRAAETATGYEYAVNPLVENTNSLDALEGSLPKLPSPKAKKE
jgi:hypothetical protein